MNPSREIDSAARLEVGKTGRPATVSLDVPRGVTALVDDDPANRAAAFDAIRFALGGPEPISTAPSGERVVRLTLGEKTYERVTDGSEEVRSRAGPQRPERRPHASEFAFLHGSSGVRRGATSEDGLRDLLVSTARRRESENADPGGSRTSRATDQRRARASALERRLTTLREQRETLRDQIESMSADVRAAFTHLEREESTSVAGAAPGDPPDASSSEIREAIRRLVEGRAAISAKREGVAAIEDELADDRRALADRSAGSPDREAAVTEELADAREEKQRLDQEIRDVRNVMRISETLLDEDGSDVLSAVETGRSTPSAAGDAGNSRTVSCWACGTNVQPSRIEHALETLRTVLSRKLDEADRIEGRIAELQSAKRRAEDERSEREALRNRIGDAESEIREIEGEIDHLAERNADRLHDIARARAGTVGQSDAGLPDPDRKLMRLLLELHRAETKLDDATKRIDAVERERRAIDPYDEPREPPLDSSNASPEPIADVESHLLPQFNTTMDVLLRKLDARPFERIRIVRRRSSDSGSGTRAFQLEVGRGADRDDAVPVSSLCAAEREVATLIFGLACYLVRGTYEDVPLLALDAVGSLEPGQVETLVEYFAGFVDYLLVGAPPAAARTIGDETVRLPNGHSIFE